MINYITSQGNALILADENEIRVPIFHSSPIIYKNAKKFVDDIPLLFKNAKGMLLNVFMHSPIGFKTNNDFCEAIRKKLDFLRIRYSFLSGRSSATSYIIFFANVKLEFGETFIVVSVTSAVLCISEYEYTLNGYKVLYDKTLDISVKEEDPKLVRDKILGQSNPKKIILVCAEANNAKFFRNVLKSNKLVAFDKMPGATENAIDEIAKWLFDESFIKYHIIPLCERNYFFVTVMGKKAFRITFLEPSERLPVNKTFTVSRCNEKIVYGDIGDGKIHEIIAVEKRCHQNKLIVMIDMENFIKVKHDAVIFPQLEAFAMNLTSKHSEMKIPVIGILDGISVICLRKDGGYKFLDLWNGVYGKELAISFDEEKPKFFEDAFRALLHKPTFGVYDLMKTMSMSPDNVEIDEKWKFTITKDSKNPILLEFDTFEKTTKFSTPAFLMAMIIRQHLKAIKMKIKEKPAEIGISILDDFNENEKIRVEKQLKESCEMLKIVCKFVKV